jgi:MFS family permease
MIDDEPTIDTEHANRTVKTFALASFLHDLGAEMVFSVWPLYVRNVLGADMAVLGFIDGLGDAIVSISQAISGYVSDRIKKRKIFVWMGYCFGGIARLGYAFAGTWSHLIPWRILDRSGKMRSSPRDAIIAENSVDRNRGGNFGILRFMDNAGAVVGIILAILLLNVLGYRNLFLFAAIPSFLAMAVVIFKIRERKAEHIHIYKGIRFKDLDGNVRLYFFLSAILTLGTFSYSFLLIAASSFGFRATTVPLLYLLYSFVAMVVSIPFGRLADRIGRKTVLQFALLCWALVGLVFIGWHSMTGMIVGFTLYGLFNGALDPVQRTLVAELAPPQFLASTLGGFQMIIGLVSLPASLIAGLLWDRFGSGAPFLFSLVLTVIASVLLLFIKERKRNVA